MARSPPLPLSRLVVYAFTILALQAISGSSFQLGRRAAQTSAFCRPEFGWMNNSLGQSPCLVGAHLLAPCQRTGVGNVQAINTSYLAPTAEGAEACWCSWGVYNTLQACALCQSDETTATTWYNYRTNCSEELQPMKEFYPDDTPIADETAVPFWATINPTTWNSGIFNTTQAQAIVNEEHEDVTQASRQAASSSSSTGSATATSDSDSDEGSSVNIGAIVGGVVGGVVVIVAGALAAFFFMRYKKKQNQPQWDYKEPDTTVSPLVASGLPGGPRPPSGGYVGVPRIDTNSNIRVDLASPDHASHSNSYGGFNAYNSYGGYNTGNEYTAASSSSGVVSQSAVVDHAASPPPYTDSSVVVPPVKGGHR